MDEQKLAELHQLIDRWAGSLGATEIEFTPPMLEDEGTPARVLPKDKRVVRTKSTGDRVYLVDELAKTKAWVTSAEILEKLGFKMEDVQEVEDTELVGYAMTASVYKVD